MHETKINDNSGDKKYFTTIPNIVIDTATTAELRVYIHFKKICGENGTCYVSLRNLKEKIGMHHKIIKAATESMIEKGWITHVGYLPKGKHGQSVREIAITDIWQKNVAQYSQTGPSVSKQTHLAVSIQTHLEPVAVSEMTHSGVSKRTRNKNQSNTNKNQKDTAPSADVVEIIDFFEPVNPSFGKWYANKTQRAAIERLLAIHGKEKLVKVIAILPKTNRRAYLPTATTPLELEDRWAKLAAGLIKEKEKLKANGKEIII